MSAKGYVYVLSNPSMPGIVKIGHSVNGGDSRAKAIWTTGVPTKFKVEFEILIDNPQSLERRVHERLSGLRINASREFFRCDIFIAVAAILDEFAAYFDMTVIHADEYSAVKGAKYLADKINDHHIDVCDAIYFVSEKAIKKAVSENNRRKNSVTK